MAEIRVKAQYKNVVIGFNHSGEPLGGRNDLHILISIAKANNRQDYLDMFEEIPNENELLEIKERAFEEKQRIKKESRKLILQQQSQQQ